MQIFENERTSQSLILSPFLFNLYMDDLDKYIENLKYTIKKFPNYNQEAAKTYNKILNTFKINKN